MKAPAGRDPDCLSYEPRTFVCFADLKADLFHVEGEDKSPLTERNDATLHLDPS